MIMGSIHQKQADFNQLESKSEYSKLPSWVSGVSVWSPLIASQ